MIQKNGGEGEGERDNNRERDYGVLPDCGEEEEIERVVGGRLEEQKEEKREGIGERKMLY